MTAETPITEDQKAPATETENATQLPTEILDIFKHLSCNTSSKIFFKSQQIDDPELPCNEKVEIARALYERNRLSFLSRFGGFLEEHHLRTFARLATTTRPLSDDENGDEMQLMLYDYQRKLHTRKLDVKNRRYAVMQQLIAKGEYFSELEMMKRSPELYQDLIGQYLSEAEKKERDSYDVKNTCFSGILMHTMQQRALEDVLQQAEKQNKQKEEKSTERVWVPPSPVQSPVIYAEEESTAPLASADAFDVPASFRQQWGNFDNEQIACSTSRLQPCNTPPKDNKIVRPIKRSSRPAAEFITGGERELLRQEFTGLMHEQFLNGLDEDFDYTQVDDDSQLDDLRQLNQDKEDAYFEGSDDGDNEVRNGNDEENIERIEDQSDDELDIYMSHLNNHHSLQTI